MKAAIIEVNPLPTVAQVLADDWFISFCDKHTFDAQLWAKSMIESFDHLWGGIPTSLPLQTVVNTMESLETDYEEFEPSDVEALNESTSLMMEHYGQ